MTSKRKPGSTAESKRWMLYVVFVALVAWVGLAGVVQLEISVTTKALFFLLLFLSVMCTVMPPIAYLHARFGRRQDSRTRRARFVRQSIWCAALVVVIAWLQMQRVLNSTLAIILTAVFVLIETFLVTREIPA